MSLVSTGELREMFEAAYASNHDIVYKYLYTVYVLAAVTGVQCLLLLQKGCMKHSKLHIHTSIFI